MSHSIPQVSHPSIEQAAQAIIALINSRPTSPRQDEIAAVIAKAMVSTSAQPDYAPTSRMGELRTIISAIEAIEDAAGGSAELNDNEQEEIEKLYKPFDRLTRAVWKTPVRTLTDLQERALIVRHQHREQPCIDSNGCKEQKERVWTDPSEIDDWDERGVAHLVQAVLQFAGGPALTVDAARREMWNAANAKRNAAWARAHALRETDADDAALDAVSEAAADIDNELDDVCRRIWREGTADIVLLERMAYQALWSGDLTADDAPEQLASGPANGFSDHGNEEDICVQAVVALLTAIRSIALQA